MSGTFMDISVPPALLSFGITTADPEDIMSAEFKEENSTIVRIHTCRDEDSIIDTDAYKKAMDRIHDMIIEGKIIAAAPVGKGGVFITLIKMAAGNGVGFKVNGISRSELTGAGYGDMIIEIPASADVSEELAGVRHEVIGVTAGDGRIEIKSEDDSFSAVLDEVIKLWAHPLEEVFPVRTDDYKDRIDDTHVKSVSFTERNTARSALKTVKPRVLIPVFPGTNCEVDSARAFEKAGAEADIHIIRNLNRDQLIISMEEMTEKIRNSQMIMIPGGFSGGDEPDGSAKFITAVFRNPQIAEAVTDLMDNRDGLMLGICNGFQALIKLGLLPYGKITDIGADSPTLTCNKIGRHVSCLVRTRVASVKSPWLAKLEAGAVHTLPVSHGEGRFIASEEMLKDLEKNGQIAMQYVDFDGKPSMDIKYNPNYSDMAIEAITSPDGRILGKMGHSERKGDNVYKNVPGDKDQKIFESGVAYFK